LQTYLFYDIETTGLNKAFDQVLQFAAIRTDVNLNELNRYELNIKLNADVIPSPSALLTHKISIKDTLNGLSEYHAIKQIHQWLNEPGTISLGYNSLSFDDEFLRFSFYRNLLPPYTHQYANQCGRMDIFPIAVMYFLYKNDVLKWPEQTGKISLKLENINGANEFSAGRSHHAMVDVEITLSLAKRFLQEPAMWQYLQGYFNKQRDLDRIKQTQAHQAILIDSSFGFDKRYQSPVSFLGFHRHYKNQSQWLCLDSVELDKLPPNDWVKNVRVKNKKSGEPGFIVPFREKYWQHLTPERLTQSEQNLLSLKNYPQILEKIIEYYTDYTHPIYPETDADARLYLDGFLTSEEESLCRQFHLASPKEKSILADKFHHPTLSVLAIRILGRNFPDELSLEQHEKFASYLQKIHLDHPPIDYQGKIRLTSQTALREISTLLSQHDANEESRLLLKDLERYITDK
jgi:exodeoxyribonuclease I